MSGRNPPSLAGSNGDGEFLDELAPLLYRRAAVKVPVDGYRGVGSLQQDVGMCHWGVKRKSDLSSAVLVINPTWGMEYKHLQLWLYFFEDTSATASVLP
jgi:hypothetical protein